MEEKQLFGNLTVYRERGARLRQLEQFEKARAAFDTAFQTHPDDVRLLIGRSQLCSDAVQPAQAFADAEASLKLEPRNMLARNMQARAMYTFCEFERSLVGNYRGQRARRQPPYFTEGIATAAETIEDCVGANAGDVMLDFLPMIQDNQVVIADPYEPKKIVRQSRIPRPKSKEIMTQLEARKHSTLYRVLAMKYLGVLANDRFFLDRLMKDPRLKSANAAGSEQLKLLTDIAHCQLAERQEMLRSQRPYYSIKLAERAASKYQDNFQAAVLRQEQKTGQRTAERLIRDLEKNMREGRIRNLIDLAERLQIFLDTKIPRTLPNKELYIDRLYRAVGEGYLKQYRLSYFMTDRGNSRRVAFLMGLPIGRPKSFDSVMATYPYKFTSIDFALADVTDTLEKCENSTMRCYLLYELSKLECAQKNYALSKFYGKRCQRQALEIDNLVWWFDGLFALLAGDFQQGNSNEVRVLVEEGLEKSKQLMNSERLQAFLVKCLKMASDPPLADEQRLIGQRQRQILATMLDGEKVEASVLFKRMSTVPVGRRFSVLPRRRAAGEAERVERHRRRQRGLTVVPGEPPTLPAPPHSHTLGFQKFDT